MPSYTETENRIADYLLQHSSESVLSSAQSLGEQIGVSPSAVIRFSHKLGYRGFIALKVDLARDNPAEINNFDDMIDENDSMETVVKKAENLNKMLNNQAYRLINVEALGKAVEALIDCHNIYLFGVSGSGIVCMDLMEKLTRINRMVVYHNDFHDQLAAAAHMTAQDVAIAISYGGKTREVNTAVQYAKEIGSKTIAITQFKKSQLAKLADILLYIPTNERELRLGAIASRNASLIVTDLLYLGLAKNEMNTTKDYLIKTKQVIQRLK